MKSREAFNPSKPFVFPPIIESRGIQSGCGTLIGGTVLAVIAISVVSALVNTPTPNVPTRATPPTIAPVAATPVPASHQDTNTVVTTPLTPSAAPTPTTPVPSDAGPALPLKDNSHFPTTVVIATHLDVPTSSGGFGLDPGDEVTVDSRQPDGSYVINHGGQQFAVASKLIDDAKIK